MVFQTFHLNKTKYIDIQKRIKKRSMDERVGNVDRYRDLESHYEPIIKSQREMREDIVHHLQPIHKGLVGVNEQMRVKQEQQPLRARKRTRTISPLANPLADEYFKRLQQQDRDIDTTFGIYITRDNVPRIGDKAIKIDGDDIIIADRVYEATPGLWSLITEKKTISYTREDLIVHRDIMEQTNALHREYDRNNHLPRASGSPKWRKILSFI